MLKSKPPLLLRIERFQAHSLNREKYTSNNLLIMNSLAMF